MSSEIAGFPELSVKDEQVMQRVMTEIKAVYNKFGFGPLETRLVEYADVLQEKGIDGKEVYTLARLHDGEIDKGKETKKILALRFDLTVPLARFVGQHARELSFPFKRFQVQKVYRGETAKESTGRFREFYQSDVDVIGFQDLSLSYDSEFPCVIYEIFKNVFCLDRFSIRINNRKFLEGLFEFIGIEDVEKIKSCVKVVDNLEKVSESNSVSSLNMLGLSIETAQNLLEFFKLCRGSDPIEVADALEDTFADQNSRLLSDGVKELAEVIRGIRDLGVPTRYFRIDPSIARGLDYYTGTVYETQLLDHPEIGSACSGGRYAELVGTLSNNPNDKFPGSGVSIGLSRIVPLLIKKGYLRSAGQVNTTVLITVQDQTRLQDYQKIARRLRESGVSCSIYYNSAKLPKQLKHASQAGYKFAVIANGSELDQGFVNVKNLSTTKQQSVSFMSDVFTSLFVTSDEGKAEEVPVATAASEAVTPVRDELVQKFHSFFFNQ